MVTRKTKLPNNLTKRREAAMQQEIRHSRQSLRYSLGAGSSKLRQAQAEAEAHIRRKYGR